MENKKNEEFDLDGDFEEFDHTDMSDSVTEQETPADLEIEEYEIEGIESLDDDTFRNEEDNDFEDEYEEQATKNGMSSTFKILMWTTIILVSGFVVILAFTMIGSSTPREIQPREIQPIQPRQQAVEQNQELIMEEVSKFEPIHEVEPVPISQISQDELPEGLRPKPIIDPLTGEQVYALEYQQHQLDIVEMPPKDEVTSETEALAARFDQVLKVLEEHSQQIDLLIASKTGALEQMEAGVEDAKQKQGEAASQTLTLSEEEIVGLKERIEQQEQAIADHEAMVADLMNEKTELETRMTELNKIKDDLLVINEDLEVEKKKLVGANIWLRKLHSDKEREIASQSVEIDRLTQELTRVLDKPVLPGWEIVGMTEDEVVFYDKFRLLRLKQGDSFAGIHFSHIDVAKQIVETNYGTIIYRGAANDGAQKITRRPISQNR